MLANIRCLFIHLYCLPTLLMHLNIKLNWAIVLLWVVGYAISSLNFQQLKQRVKEIWVSSCPPQRVAQIAVILMSWSCALASEIDFVNWLTKWPTDRTSKSVFSQNSFWLHALKQTSRFTAISSSNGHCLVICVLTYIGIWPQTCICNGETLKRIAVILQSIENVCWYYLYLSIVTNDDSAGSRNLKNFKFCHGVWKTTPSTNTISTSFFSVQDIIWNIPLRLIRAIHVTENALSSSQFERT